MILSTSSVDRCLFGVLIISMVSSTKTIVRATFFIYRLKHRELLIHYNLRIRFCTNMCGEKYTWIKQYNTMNYVAESKTYNHTNTRINCSKFKNVFGNACDEAFATKWWCEWVLIDISYTQKSSNHSRSQWWEGWCLYKSHQYVTRIQSRPGKRILWRTISPIMQPTDHISTVLAEVREERKREEAEVSVRLLERTEQR